jgi:hypothetical protein
MAVTLNASTTTGLVQSADTSGIIQLQSNGTTALTVNTNEGIQILNCLGVGNATPSTSGAGITFPASQSASTDANTLDDYEEGSWTPTLVAIGGSFTSNPTYTVQTGTYTKIGRFVYCNFRITLSNKGTTTGSPYAGIGGFPFTVGASVLGTGNLYFTNLNANWITLILQPNASDTNAYLIGSKAAATDIVYTSILANNFPDLTNTTLLSGNFVYAV